ncbi:hypothetical protein B0H17DRAFT_1146778 [Mycena rosella]|uniref:Uncharacterized protein n=1 Tax=Mycena rosella TaxID=1033263 RepID=A0AAD7G0E5_MYCRO|nr:hypothetical protein B0H17DRAFT_1146778 [Mycena rosella]
MGPPLQTHSTGPIPHDSTVAPQQISTSLRNEESLAYLAVVIPSNGRNCVLSGPRAHVPIDGIAQDRVARILFGPPPSLVDDADDADHSKSDFVDSVRSSQPFDNGEEDLRLYETPSRLHFPAPSAWAILSDSTTDPASDSARRRRLIPGAEMSISTLTPSVRSRNLVYRVGLVRVPIAGCPISRVARHSRHKSNMGPGISPWSSRKLCCVMRAVQDESEGEQEDDAEQGFFSQALFMANQVPVVSPAPADTTSSGFVA